MSIFELFLKEIRFHRVNFLISIFSLSSIVCSLIVFSSIVLSAHNNRLLSIRAKEALTNKLMADMISDYRTITDNMGYTIRVLPKKQSMEDFYSSGFAKEYFSQAVTDTLSSLFSKDIRCALPVLRIKSEWSPLKRTVLFTGTGNPYVIPGNKLPSTIPIVANSTIALGFELPTYPVAIEKSRIAIKGKFFLVKSCEGQKGSLDDITVWITLTDLSSAFSISNKISEIWIWPVLDTAHAITQLAARIEQQIPSCKVITITAPALLQIQARETAVRIAKEATLKEVIANRELFAKQKRALLLFSVIITVASMIWCAILILQNAAVRQEELMVLRVIGHKNNSISLLLGIRALVLGICGITIGLAIGFLLLPILHLKESYSPLVITTSSALLCIIISFIGIISGIMSIESNSIMVLNRADQCL